MEWIGFGSGATGPEGLACDVDTFTASSRDASTDLCLEGWRVKGRWCGSLRIGRCWVWRWSCRCWWEICMGLWRWMKHARRCGVRSGELLVEQCVLLLKHLNLSLQHHLLILHLVLNLMNLIPKVYVITSSRKIHTLVRRVRCDHRSYHSRISKFPQRLKHAEVGVHHRSCCHRG